jgi:pSer/pThr/pTyr-binding forkhead associated (FHA) protein
MTRLYEFVIPVRRTSREDFASTNTHFFLLLHRKEEEREQGWTFKTKTVSLASAKIAKLQMMEDVKLLPEIAEYDVFPVVKAHDNPWAERISIGRARNNDIVLPDSSVSKLHAHIKLSDNEGVFVIDAGSRNGTRVNSAKVPSGELVRIDVGDIVTFGRTTVILLDGASLYDLVARHVDEKSDA